MIPIERSHLLVAACTDAGKSGKQNEDRFAVIAHQVSAASSTRSVFAVIADGIGGRRRGEEAAALAVNLLCHAISSSNSFEPVTLLRQAMLHASAAIAARSRSDPHAQGMGTTCACAWILGQRLYIASVGDSRIYLLRARSIHRLTTDHTWIQEAVERGIINPKDLPQHPDIHVLRRYLGSNEPPRVDTRLRLHASESDAQAEANQGKVLQPGDWILLCSDGLTDMLSDSQVTACIHGSSDRDLDQSAHRLVDLANSLGGHDNITVILLQVPESLPPEPHMRPAWLLPLLGGIFLLLILAFLLMLAFWR